MKNLIVMIIIFILIMMIPTHPKAQIFTKNDWHTMLVQVPIGYIQGVRDQVIYHPVQLFKQFPNLNHNFWDIRIQGKKGFLNTQWDADHIFKSSIIGGEVVCIAFKFGEKQTFKKVLINTIANYMAYKLGFFLAYNLTFKNKL